MVSFACARSCQWFVVVTVVFQIVVNFMILNYCRFRWEFATHKFRRISTEILMKLFLSRTSTHRCDFTLYFEMTVYIWFQRRKNHSFAARRPSQTILSILIENKMNVWIHKRSIHQSFSRNNNFASNINTELGFLSVIERML